MNSRFLCCLIALFFVAPDSSAQEDELPAVIALFGDSITVGENNSSYFSDCPQGGGLRRGFGLGRTNFCTPDMELSRLLNESGRSVIVTNHGIGGTTTGPGPINSALNGLDRMRDALRQTKQEHDGRIYYVVIFYGTNDPASGITLSATRTNIIGMISVARQEGYIPIVGNLLPRNTRSVAQENMFIESAASISSALFVDQFTNFQSRGGINLHEIEFFNGNTLQIHPRAEGYRIVAQRWFDAAFQNLIQPVIAEEPLPNITPIINLLLNDEE